MGASEHVPGSDPAADPATGAATPSPAAPGQPSSSRLEQSRSDLHEAAAERRRASAKTLAAKAEEFSAQRRWYEAAEAFDAAAKEAAAEPARAMMVEGARHARERIASGRRATTVVSVVLVAAVGGLIGWWAAQPARSTAAIDANRALSMPERVSALEESARTSEDPLALRDAALRLLPQAGPDAARVAAVGEAAAAAAAPIEARLAEIDRVRGADPRAALALAQRARAEWPLVASLAERLPLAGRIDLAATPHAQAQLTVDGVAQPVGELRFCRRPGLPSRVVVTAPGRIAATISVPASTDPAERVLPATLLEAPVWTVDCDAGSWAAVHPVADGALVVTERRLVVAGTDGALRASLDPARVGATAFLPPQEPPALAGEAVSRTLRIGTDVGSALVVTIDRAALTPRVARRGARAAGFVEADLVFRLGKRGCFAAEHATGGSQLVGTADEETLWRMPLAGKLPPYVAVEGEGLLVADATHLRLVDQEGQETRALPFPKPRTGPVVRIAGDALAYPTESGAAACIRSADGAWRLLALPQLPRPLVSGYHLACDGGVLLCATGPTLVALRWTAGVPTEAWTASLPDDRRAVAAGIAAGHACVADDTSRVTVIRVADGAVIRELELPEAAHGAPAVAGAIVVVPFADTLAGYPLTAP